MLLWRRSFDVQPPALDLHDERSPRMDARYAEMSDSEIPLTESLKDTIARLMPYYKDVIMKSFDRYNTVMVVAHGNSLRGIIKVLKNISNEDMTLYYQINYTLTDVLEDCAYFHAQFRRVNPLPYKD